VRCEDANALNNTSAFTRTQVTKESRDQTLGVISNPTYLSRSANTTQTSAVDGGGVASGGGSEVRSNGDHFRCTVRYGPSLTEAIINSTLDQQ